MKIKEIMNVQVVAVQADSTLKELFILMKQYGIRDFPVIDGSFRLKGMVYEENLLSAIYPKYRDLDPHSPQFTDIEERLPFVKNILVEDIMMKNIPVLSPEDTLIKAGALMLNQQKSSVPVLEKDVLVGLVSQSHIFLELVGEHLTKEKVQPVRGEPPPSKPARGEQRKYKRIPIRMTTAYCITEIAGTSIQSSKDKRASCFNISIGGMLLRTAEPLANGTLLDLVFKIPGERRPIRRIARVIHSAETEPGKFDIGMMFLVMAASEIKEIEDYLKNAGP